MFGIGPSEFIVVVIIAVFCIVVIGLVVAAALRILFPKQRN